MRFAWIFLLASISVVACGPTSGGADGGTDAGDAVTCDTDPRVMAWKTGASASSKDGTAAIVVDSANPEPPARGTNSWTVHVTDASGAMLTDASLAVQPFMPDHGHGSSVEATITPTGDGHFTVTPLYLFMPGVWQVNFTVTLAGGKKELVTFGLCIAG